MNAKDWGSQLDTPPLKRNQFGGTLGGPIAHEPDLLLRSYSGLRQTTSTFLNNAIVPTALERTGDFSASRTHAHRSGDRPDLRLQRRRRRDLPQPPRSGGDEDHQQLHPARQRAGQHLAGLRATARTTPTSSW